MLGGKKLVVGDLLLSARHGSSVKIRARWALRAMAVTSTTGTLVAGARLGATWASVPGTAGIVGTGLRR